MGTMYCTNCGKSLPEGSAFCVHCGAKLAEKTEKKSQITLPAAKLPKTRTIAVGKKKGVIIAAACIIGIAGIGLAGTKMLTSPRKKVVSAFKKTVEQAVDGKTSLNRIFGISDMLLKVKEGKTSQIIEVTALGENLGMRSEIFSDQNAKENAMNLYPVWQGMELGKLSVYSKEQMLYFGAPDILDALFYVDLANVKDEIRGSAAGMMFREMTGEELSQLLPDPDEKEKIPSYKTYCKAEIEKLYNNMEVVKDGKESVKIGGKNQSCRKYQITISGKDIKKLIAKSAEYGLEEMAASVITPGIYQYYYTMSPSAVTNQFLSYLNIDDIEMEACLDKKGRVVKLQGEWKASFQNEAASMDFEVILSGKDSPADEIEGSILLTNNSGSAVEFTIEREKKYDSKKGITDSIELAMNDSGYRDAIGYEFSYNIANGDWEVSVSDGYDYYGAEGKISNLKKGRAITLEVDSVTRNSMALFEGSYELAELDKNGVPVPHGAGEAVSILDMSRQELIRLWADLSAKSLGEGNYFGMGSSSSQPAATTAASEE